MLTLTKKEKLVANRLSELKLKSGSHSPSTYAITENIHNIDIKIDACFLSNPYATDLLVDYFSKEILNKDKIKEVLEKYPLQNRNIGKFIASHFNISMNNIFVGNGATEIIQAIIHNFTEKKILLNIPTFSPYYEFVLNKIKVLYNTLQKHNNFRLDLDKYIEIIEIEKPDTVVLINPNNPDGSYLDLDSIYYLLKKLKFVNTIVIDESFVHFVPGTNKGLLDNNPEIIGKYSNLIIVQSLSKHFGISGVRSGFAVMSENRVANLLSKGYLWNVSGLAQYFIKTISSSEFQEDYRIVLNKYITETQQFFSILSTINGFKTYSSKSNFCLIELKNGIETIDLAAKLLSSYGIYVRDCSDKLGLDDKFIRVSSKTKSENELIAKSMTEIFNS